MGVAKNAIYFHYGAIYSVLYTLQKDSRLTSVFLAVPWSLRLQILKKPVRFHQEHCVEIGVVAGVYFAWEVTLSDTKTKQLWKVEQTC